VISTLAQHLKPVLLQALTESAADGWLGWQRAAAYVYGRDDRLNAFRSLVHRHPELARMAHGKGKLKRWKRTDLDQWLRESPFPHANKPL
jgi:hypothetical protein